MCEKRVGSIIVCVIDSNAVHFAKHHIERDIGRLVITGNVGPLIAVARSNGWATIISGKCRIEISGVAKTL
jgi:hypothetical protein